MNKRIPKMTGNASVDIWLEQSRKINKCKHKFVDSKFCIKCGWRPK